MTAEIKENNDNSLTIKHLNDKQLEVFNNIFGNPMGDKNNLVNSKNSQYKLDAIQINGKKYAYSVYDVPNNGEDTYTIGIQMLRD